MKKLLKTDNTINILFCVFIAINFFIQVIELINQTGAGITNTELVVDVALLVIWAPIFIKGKLYKNKYYLFFGILFITTFILEIIN